MSKISGSTGLCLFHMDSQSSEDLHNESHFSVLITKAFKTVYCPSLARQVILLQAFFLFLTWTRLETIYSAAALESPPSVYLCLPENKGCVLFFLFDCSQQNNSIHLTCCSHLLVKVSHVQFQKKHTIGHFILRVILFLVIYQPAASPFDWHAFSQ